MSNTTAQATVIAYMKDWFETIGPDFIEDSIRGSGDSETIAALDLVGFDFDWDVKVTVNWTISLLIN